MPGAPQPPNQRRSLTSCARSTLPSWTLCSRPLNIDCRGPPIAIRWAVTAVVSRTRCASRGLLIRLVTGCSWVDVEALMGRVVSDTTLRARRDEWVAAGVFDDLAAEAIDAYDRIIGLDFTDAAL